MIERLFYSDSKKKLSFKQKEIIIMPVSKNKLKIPRLYLQLIRKTCNLTRSELSQKLGVATSSIDRYENGSCDFKPENMDKLFTKLSDISGIAMSSLLQSETAYQKQSQQIRNAAKEEKISMPSLYYQKQFLCIKHIEETIGISNLAHNLQPVARLRYQHPDWSNKLIANTFGVSSGVVANCFLKIKHLIY